MAVAAAVAAVVLKLSLFDHLSIDNDEAINALFADTLAHGRLFPPTMGEPDAFRPWLAAADGDHFVLKYPPVVPGLIAASLLLTGGPGLYLALVAALNVVVTYLLASEALRTRTEALLATALVVLSPLVLVHSALLLAYLPTFVLLEAFAWGLLRGLSSGRSWPFAVSGLALGLAFFVRSFDAAVFAAPLLAWAVVGQRRSLGPATVAWFVSAAAVPVAGLAAFNAVAAGSPLRPTFSLLEPKDTVGFGQRRLYPTDALRSFGPKEGLVGLVRHGMLFDRWVAGGAILVVLAAVTIVRRRVGGPVWPLVASGFLVPVAYVPFWGPWNASVLWGGTRYVGPLYFMAVLVPLSLCGARGLMDLHRWRPAAGAAAVVAMAGLTAATMVVTVRDNARFNDQNMALARLVEGHSPRSLVFVAPPAPFLMHPSGVLTNRSDLRGPVVYAVERGAEDLDLVRRFPERTPYRLRFEGSFTRPDRPLSGRLDQLRLVGGPRLELSLLVRAPDAPEALTLEVSGVGLTTAFPITAGSSSVHRLVLTDQGAQLEGQPPQPARPSPSTDLEVSLLGGAGELGPPGSGPPEPAVLAYERYPLRRSGGSMELLAPGGRNWTTGPDPAAAIVVKADEDAAR